MPFGDNFSGQVTGAYHEIDPNRGGGFSDWNVGGAAAWNFGRGRLAVTPAHRG